jgi:hypothetical protein
MDLRVIGWGGVEWIYLAWDRDRWWAVVNAVMNLRVLAPWSYLVSCLVSYGCEIRFLMLREGQR